MPLSWPTASFSQTPSANTKNPTSRTKRKPPVHSTIRPSRLLFTNLRHILSPPIVMISLQHRNIERLAAPPYICLGHDLCFPTLRPLCNTRSSQRNTLLHALSTRLIFSPFSFRTPRIIVLCPFHPATIRRTLLVCMQVTMIVICISMLM